MVSVLDSGSSGQGSCTDWGHYFVVFLGETLYSHSVSLHPNKMLGVTCGGLASHLGGVAILLVGFMLRKPG